MSTEIIPGGVGTAPNPADTQAAKRLTTRALVIAGTWDGGL